LTTIINRLPKQPLEIINRSKEISISFNGKQIHAYDGDTIGSALYSSGIRTFSRSFKYHRPRGLFCTSGKCANCLMNVNGIPNVRICTETVKDGMVVKHQNAWPSLSTDLFSIVGKLSNFLPVGFYYKMFIKPKFIWPIAEKILRRIAGLGTVDPKYPVNYDHLSQKYIHVDVLVIGGGPSGLLSSLNVATNNVNVLLIDDQPKLGGHFRFNNNISDLPPEFSKKNSFEIIQDLKQATQRSNIQIINNTTVVGSYSNNSFIAVNKNQLIKIRAKSVIIATGNRQRPFVFKNNDLPGIFLGSAVQRLIYLYGVNPGNNYVVVTSNDSGIQLANELIDLGLNVEYVIDSRPKNTPDPLFKSNTAFLSQSIITEAKGKTKVNSIITMKIGKDGVPISGSEQEIKCDTVCLVVGTDSENGLLYQSDSKIQYDPTLDEMIPINSKSNIYAVGDVTGIHNFQIHNLQSKIASINAVIDILKSNKSFNLKNKTSEKTNYLSQLKIMEEKYYKQININPLHFSPIKNGKKFVCTCEDVTEQDILDSIDEGFDNIETLKRYSTVNMGPCQGKMCSTASIAICAHSTSKQIQDVGVTTSRPPISPISLAILSAGKQKPVKLTPMHYKHLDHKATMMSMGEWKRPLFYSSPEQEYNCVRKNVGIIDVSTLGKLHVKGKDSTKLLDFVYTQKFSNLNIGRVRYSVICDESGSIVDDGTVTRLNDEQFFITTTTGNIEFVEQWFKWWIVSLNLDVHVVNVTSNYAAVNVAGPNARDTLTKLTSIDLTNDHFPYMSCKETNIANVPVIMFRIGFVGETGWEIHFPSQYGEYLWDKIIDAGQKYNILPFGVEAQRILRLDKGHIIVGQDTDALSTPFESNMNWVMKFDKPDFVGKQSLLRFQNRILNRKQIAFVTESRIEDGNGVTLNGQPIGFITSARFSPSLNKFVGLALVSQKITPSSNVSVSHNGKLVKCILVDEPFYDAKGTRLRM